MADDRIITTKLLLEHIQANAGTIERLSHKVDRLSESINSVTHTVDGLSYTMTSLSQTVDGLSERVNSIDHKLNRLEYVVKEGFEDAREDRQGLHDDLDATIRMQADYQTNLAVLTGGPMPEEY